MKENNRREEIGEKESEYKIDKGVMTVWRIYLENINGRGQLHKA